MKKTFLRFAPKAYTPRINNRRMGLRADGFHNISYKSDGDDDDDVTAKFEAKLKSLETSLDGKLTTKAKAEVEAQLKSVKDELETLKKSIGKPDEATTKSITDLETRLKAAEEAATKNQPVIDAFVINKDNHNTNRPLPTFEQAVADAVMNVKDDVEKFIRKETRELAIELKAFEQKTVGDMTTSNVTGGSRYGQQFAPNIIERPYRKVHVRDLIPVQQAGPGNTFTFMKENGAGEGAIAPTAETSTKPQIDKDLIEATVNFETIAGWLRVTRKAMNNIPGFVAWLQRRLPEDLMRIEDAQILYGDGVSPNLKGIGTAGNFTLAHSSPTVNGLAEKLIDALAQLEDDNERYATGIVIRPRAYYNFFKNKATGGSEEYDLPRNFVFVNNILYVSGIPVIPTTAVTAGDFFVGDWLEGAALMVQEGMRLEFFEQDGTNVRENKITLRIEETVALPVYGSDYFIKGTDADQS